MSADSEVTELVSAVTTLQVVIFGERNTVVLNAYPSTRLPTPFVRKAHFGFRPFHESRRAGIDRNRGALELSISLAFRGSVAASSMKKASLSRLNVEELGQASRVQYSLVASSRLAADTSGGRQ